VAVVVAGGGDGGGGGGGGGVGSVVVLPTTFFSRKMFAEYSLGLGIVFAECLTIDTRQNSLCC